MEQVDKSLTLDTEDHHTELYRAPGAPTSAFFLVVLGKREAAPVPASSDPQSRTLILNSEDRLGWRRGISAAKARPDLSALHWM